MTDLMTAPLFDVEGESARRADAPAARLLLPADASREDWEAVRRNGIGGSDVAGILGLAGKYNSPRRVYEEKHGRSTFKDTEPAEIGREIEQFIAMMFSKRSGHQIAVPPGTLQNIERQWMRANVDRYVVDESGAVVLAPLECKNRSEYQIDDWEDGVPDAPAIQCYWYMAVGGWSHGYVAALVGGNKLRWHRLERDEDIIGELVEHCEQWYQRHIVEGFPPPADALEDTTNLLARLWEVTPESVAEVDADTATKLLDDHARLAQKVKAAQDEVRLVENEMRLIAGENEIVKDSNGKVVWTNKQNSTFAPKRFREERPDLAARFTHQVDALDMDRLKTEEPDVYRTFRARQLRPTKPTKPKAKKGA
ncbi:YqaJ viral recombinase family protein [Streptomyces sp. NPDC056291]|uniref:YqaJ viral recombinase family nuclease n=1 Tax=Streptomyces sp. NPDC056291 TaxID=3345772 RepID=UPI0035E340CE